MFFFNLLGVGCRIRILLSANVERVLTPTWCHRLPMCMYTEHIHFVLVNTTSTHDDLTVNDTKDNEVSSM